MKNATKKGGRNRKVLININAKDENAERMEFISLEFKF